MSERMPEAPIERTERNEQDLAFEEAKAALAEGNMEAFFGRLDAAMAKLGEADAVAWQKLAVEIYAAGAAKLTSEEMARQYDEKFGDPDTREWMFGHV
ncbi:MAG: hypothetical protein AAB554_00455 [Patescibacteria group bacterium]